MHEVNGSLKRYGFWQINIGHIIVLVGMCGAFLIWWQSFGSLPGKNTESISQLISLVDKINEKGTTGSRLKLAEEQGELNAVKERLTKLETNYSSLNEK